MIAAGKNRDGARRPAAGPARDAPATAGCWRDREEFKARVLEWARTLNVGAKSIYVRPMRRKWASCSTAGTLSFNDELLDLARDLGDYVIAHELLHFSVPNHGKLWKSLMRVHLGDWESVAARLPRIQTKMRKTRQKAAFSCQRARRRLACRRRADKCHFSP